MKRTVLILILVSSALVLTGCLPGDGRHSERDRAGLVWGVWHGWIAPISLFFGAFRSDIRVYEVHNVGWWYDLGFYAAVISGFGGLSLVRKKKD